VVLDTIESLFSSFSNQAILRAELRRLFRWLKDRGVTAVITAERGEGALTRNGLEEYVSDCVILLDHRVSEQLSTRRLRIVKYRGSSHGTNEYPFIIDEEGIEVLPITDLGLDHVVSRERVPTGIPSFDDALGGKGFYRGSTVLISGTAGTGKSSLAAQIAEDACRRGERTIYFSFEESPSQVIRNMRSIGVDLEKWRASGLLRFEAARPTLLGLEAHLVRILRMVREFKPRWVIVDPVTNFLSAGSESAAESMLIRLIDLFKSRGITAVLTSLTAGGNDPEDTQVGISSLVDTWILLRAVDSDGERRRALSILKSRGMSHSHSVRELRLTSDGVEVAGPAEHQDHRSSRFAAVRSRPS
jgi:circadian clock protein KaiC